MKGETDIAWEEDISTKEDRTLTEEDAPRDSIYIRSRHDRLGEEGGVERL